MYSKNGNQYSDNGNGQAQTLTIGIVGGSIAGCTAAIELSRAGHQVTVFERSPVALKDRGAGMAAPVDTIKTLVERDLIDADMPHFLINEIPHIGRSEEEEPYGHVAWRVPVTMKPFNWGDLYRNLRARVPETIYHYGCKVTAINNTAGKKATIQFDDGHIQEFDLVICADGYRSLGRQTICPEVEMNYRGYVLWRCVLKEDQLPTIEPIDNNIARLSYSEGHAVFYLVPGADGTCEPGERWVNAAMYVRVPEDELPQFLVGANGYQHQGSIPPGNMRPELEKGLKALAREHLPAYFADIMEASEYHFAQAIYLIDVPSYYDGRICLIGDAGAVAPPYTASGVFKGMNNAIDLAEALGCAGCVDDAIAEWSAEQTATGKRMVALGRRLEQALIWNVPDFSQMEETEMKAWWENAAKMPEDIFVAEKQ